MEQELPPVVERFRTALHARDFDGIAACFHADALLVAVVPPGVREDAGPEQIAARYRRWLDDGAGTVPESEATPFADLTRIRYVVESDGATPTAFEQTAYAEIEGDRFVRMRIACSGRRPVPSQT
jgi:hypothetical protein